MSRRGLVYLHGFASSPRSSKARFFEGRSAAAGFAFECPDLNQPDFTTLSVSRMIDDVDRAIGRCGEGPVALIGSSLGAFVALHAAAREAAARGPASRVDRLVFLAPALDLVRSLEEDFGPARMAAWQESGGLEIFHYGDNAMRTLGWDFMPDARRYDSDGVAVDLPMLIYQGRRDDVVKPEGVERWTATRPSVTLRLVDDGHQLLDHLEVMWADVARFLGDP
jgi:pimeloyl-ACP methyl ester carboxylesterase